MPRRRLVVSRLALKSRLCPSPKQVVPRAMVLALVVAGFTVLGAGQALAGHVRCGDTITTDTTLTSNLESRTGIRIRRLAWLVRVDGR